MNVMLVAAHALSLVVALVGAHDAPGGGVTGRVVVDSPQRQPLEGAIVSLVSESTRATSIGSASGPTLAAITDAAGAFRFKAVPSGRYRLLARKAGYLTAEYGSLELGKPGTPISVIDGEETEGLQVKVLQGGTITGTLLSQDGRPASSWPVIIKPSAGFGGSRLGFLTDDEGRYRIYGLPPGNYLVGAQAPAFATQADVDMQSDASVDAALKALERQFGNPDRATLGAAVARSSADGPLPSEGPPARSALQLLPVWFPGTVDEGAATRVEIAPGKTVADVNFSLVVGQTTMVAGRVLNPSGLPAAGVDVSISGSRRARTGRDGTFQIRNVVPGRSMIVARADAVTESIASTGTVTAGALTGTSTAGDVRWAQTSVDIPSSGLTGVQLQLREGLQVSGKVSFDKTQSTPRSGVRLSQRIGERLITHLVPVSSAGDFVYIGLTPGKVLVSAEAEAADRKWWVASIELNGQEIDGHFEIGESNVTGLAIAFSSAHNALSGRLLDGSGVGAPGYSIVVFSTDESLWGPDSRRNRISRSATDGAFMIGDLPAGDYWVSAATFLDEKVWADRATLSQLAQVGVKVTVRLGEQVRLDLRLGGLPF